MGAWEESAYAWVVICKNKRFHKHTNVMYGHKIPLAETDAFATPPAVSGPFTVQCDECGQEYSYEPGEVLRLELELPASFKPHPAFSAVPGVSATGVSSPQPAPTLVTGWRNGGRQRIVLQFFLDVLGRVRSGIKWCAHRISGRHKKPGSPDERQAKAKTL